MKNIVDYRNMFEDILETVGRRKSYLFWSKYAGSVEGDKWIKEYYEDYDSKLQDYLDSNDLWDFISYYTGFDANEYSLMRDHIKDRDIYWQNLTSQDAEACGIKVGMELYCFDNLGKAKKAARAGIYPKKCRALWVRNAHCRTTDYSYSWNLVAIDSDGQLMVAEVNAYEPPYLEVCEVDVFDKEVADYIAREAEYSRRTAEFFSKPRTPKRKVNSKGFTKEDLMEVKRQLELGRKVFSDSFATEFVLTLEGYQATFYSSVQLEKWAKAAGCIDNPKKGKV
jgi:hypothetical protein